MGAWAPFGSLWGAFGLSLGCPWLALGALGSLWVPLGSLGSLWELKVHRLRCLSTKSSLREHAAPREPRELTEVVSKTAARSPLSTLCGGQDEGSYTNSLKSKVIFSSHSKTHDCSFYDSIDKHPNGHVVSLQSHHKGWAGGWEAGWGLWGRWVEWKHGRLVSWSGGVNRCPFS